MFQLIRILQSSLGDYLASDTGGDVSRKTPFFSLRAHETSLVYGSQSFEETFFTPLFFPFLIIPSISGTSSFLTLGLFLVISLHAHVSHHKVTGRAANQDLAHANSRNCVAQSLIQPNTCWALGLWGEVLSSQPDPTLHSGKSSFGHPLLKTIICRKSQCIRAGIDYIIIDEKCI